MKHIVADMLDLLAALGRESAVWVGHDWGAPVVVEPRAAPPRAGAKASPAFACPTCRAAFRPHTLIATVDRALYPDRASIRPANGTTSCSTRSSSRRRSRVFDADPVATVKALFRKGDPKGLGRPGRLATVRRDGGWFGGAEQAPDLPLDRDLLTDEDLHRYASALAANGFFGPDAWYMNGSANIEYARGAANDGRLAMPVLFLHAAYDYTCDTSNPLLMQPMRQACADVTEVTLPTGHWMAQEQPSLVNAALAKWLALKFPHRWAV